MEQYVIKIKNVSKSFKGIQVLNDVNMTCRSGKIYGIVGYNGSGKTVLFKCICGFLHVDSGSISVNGKVVGKELDMLKTGYRIKRIRRQFMMPCGRLGWTPVQRKRSATIHWVCVSAWRLHRRPWKTRKY